MSRHEIPADKGTFIVGWDQHLQSFWLHFHDVMVAEDVNPVIWLPQPPDSWYEVEDLVRAAAKNGLVISQSLQTTLYGDKDDGK